MDVTEAFNRIKKANRNVVDVVVINKENLIVRSSSGDAAKEISSLIQVLDKCRASFKENDELTFLKIKTKRCEILVVPDKEFMLVALLKTSDEA